MGGAFLPGTINDTATRSAPLAPKAATRNLPRQLTSFIGREREVVEVGRLLGEARQLTIAGPGGVGKTRLAIEVAGRVDAGEVCFVELTPILDEPLVPSAIASALGIVEVLGKPLIESILDVIGNRRQLLVLDNCEHLLRCCASTVEHLLRGCPLLTVLVTSREPLTVPGEIVWSLAPLAPKEGATLFLDRAKAAEPGFNPSPETSGAIASICEQLDCLPLAIELAAACVRTLTVQEIASRLGPRFELLASRSRTGPARHLTLQALVDWSYELLSIEEQHLYRRLSVFGGGCSLDAIEGICLDEGDRDGSLLTSLRGLVEKSLVQAEQQDGETRYRMLETLRQHSAAKLEEVGADAGLRTRHLQWFLALAERGDEEGLRGPDEAWWRRRLQREMDNFRSALHWSLVARAQQQAGLGLATALGRVWWFSAHPGEGAGWLEKLLLGAPPNLTRAKALNMAAWLALRRGDRGARLLAEAALPLARELGDRALIVRAARNLGDALLDEGDPAGAKDVLEEALALGEDPDRPFGRFPLLFGLGQVMAALGRAGEGVAYLQQALALAREQQDVHLAAVVERDLGGLLLDAGDLKGAREHLEGSLALGSHPPAGAAAYAIAQFAGLAAAEGYMSCAVTLAGAATGLIEALDGKFQPIHLARLERDLKPAYDALDPKSRAAAWSVGIGMGVDEAVRYALQHDPPAASITSPLTEREREVAVLLTEGLTNRELAAHLIVSERTAKRHVEKILAKLGLRSRAQIADWAIRKGLLQSNDTQIGPR